MQTNAHLSVLIHEQAKKYGNREALVYKDFGGKEWKSISWNTFSQQITRVSNAMLALGIGVQEKVAIFSQNTLQYVLTDFGAWGIRAVTVPFYATTSEEQIQFMVSDAQIRFIFCGEQEQYDKARRVLTLCPTLEKIIVYDKRVRISTHDPNTIYFDDFLAMGDGSPYKAKLEVLYSQASYDDLACILYTSGTTGTSKGVMLPHSQFDAAFKDNHKGLSLTEKDKIFSFLPFTHIFEKGFALIGLTEGCTLIINTNPHEVQDALRETHPTCMSAVPRFWEKVYIEVKAKIEGVPAVEQKLFRRALAVGKRHNIDYIGKGKRPPLALALEYKLMNKTVFPLVKKQLGLENAHFFPTAGSFVSPEVEEFVHSIGIFMMVGYGLTESLATVSNDHTDKPFTIGSIGRPIDSLSIKFSDEGEILLKGPTITPGYYNRPDLTAQAFTADGYFRTGDVGYMKDGELYITERIKDLYKTSNGKYIAPQMIESKILVDKYVEQIAVIADQRKFVSALIVPAYKLIEDYAHEHGIDFKDREELCQHPEIIKIFADRIDTLQQTLAHYEQIKRFTLLPHHFSMDKGELTSTLKVKRNVLARNYKDVIDKMYEA